MLYAPKTGISAGKVSTIWACNVPPFLYPFQVVVRCVYGNHQGPLEVQKFSCCT